MWLLILPISFFVRFSDLVVGRFKKFSLWSFNVMKLLLVPLILILLNKEGIKHTREANVIRRLLLFCV